MAACNNSSSQQPPWEKAKHATLFNSIALATKMPEMPLSFLLKKTLKPITYIKIIASSSLMILNLHLAILISTNLIVTHCFNKQSSRRAQNLWAGTSPSSAHTYTRDSATCPVASYTKDMGRLKKVPSLIVQTRLLPVLSHTCHTRPEQSESRINALSMCWWVFLSPLWKLRFSRFDYLITTNIQNNVGLCWFYSIKPTL